MSPSLPSITVTYDPEDNKLRLTSLHRLDPETYARVTGAGFTWAPRLKQFVAPAWTPGREDLALELAGQIDDEDSSLLERAEQRAERFDGYRERRLEDAERAREAVEAITRHIPPGQPILVGRHSERHARRDQERIESGLRKAVKLWNTSEYWERRAAAALRHAKYKERPDVRHRRIKTLEAEQRKRQRERTRLDAWLSFWNRLGDPTWLTRKDGQATTMLERARYLANHCHLRVAATGGLSWSAWDTLRPDGERSPNCPAMTPEQIQEIARGTYPALIADRDRWIAHLENRLRYERALLAGQGGYQEPARPASKATLPILNYAGTVSYRNPYQPGEVITGDAAGLTKAQWAAISNDYKGSRVSACGTHRVRTAMRVPGYPHQLVAVYLTDSKQHPKPSADQVADKASEEQAQREREAAEHLRRRAAGRASTAAAPDPQAQAFGALADQLRAGVRVTIAPQLFPTPPDLAARMVELAHIQPGDRVLEPSAGTGILLRTVSAAAPVHLVAVEINPRLAAALREDGSPVVPTSTIEIHCADFLACSAELGTFDRILMNPPFANAVDIQHIEQAAGLLRPDGVLVAVCANGPRQRQALQPRATFWEDLPEGTFKTAGTQVHTALLVIERPS